MGNLRLQKSKNRPLSNTATLSSHSPGVVDRIGMDKVRVGTALDANMLQKEIVDSSLAVSVLAGILLDTSRNIQLYLDVSVFVV